MKNKQSNVKAVMVYMNSNDLAALAEVRRRLGATTNSGAIRAALRVIVQDSLPRSGGAIGAAMSKAVEKDTVGIFLLGGEDDGI